MLHYGQEPLNPHKPNENVSKTLCWLLLPPAACSWPSWLLLVASGCFWWFLVALAGLLSAPAGQLAVPTAPWRTAKSMERREFRLRQASCQLQQASCTLPGHVTSHKLALTHPRSTPQTVKMLDSGGSCLD